MAFTLTLQKIGNFAATHADLMPLAGVGGYTDEPLLSLCNDALSELITAPHDWKFNRVDLGGVWPGHAQLLVTCPSKQDYLWAGASAFALDSNAFGVGIALATNNGITESGTTVTVNTLEPHRFTVGQTVYMCGNTVAAYNSTFTDNGISSAWSNGWSVTAVPNSYSFQFTHSQPGLGTSGAPGIWNFGWLANCSLYNMIDTSSPQDNRRIQCRKEIEPWSKIANPEKVSVLADNGDGTLTVRFEPVPGSQPWGARLVYQAKAPLKVSLSDNWAPFPDHFSAVVRQALLYRMWRYLDSPKAEAEYQKLQQQIAKSLGGDDNEETEVHLVPEDSLLDSSYWTSW
jgi:hypothetical protein